MDITITDDFKSDMMVFPHITHDEYKDKMNRKDENEITINKAGSKYFEYMFHKKMENIGYIRDPSYNEFYLFYDMSSQLKELHVEDYRKNHAWKWATAVDILYERKIFNTDIYGPILQMFMNNMDLLFVYNEKNVPYSLPVNVYKKTNIEMDNNFKIPLKEDTQYGMHYVFDKNLKEDENQMVIARYIAFMRYIFMEDESRNKDIEHIYIDYFDAVFKKDKIIVKKDEQFMFIDCEINSS